MKYAFFLVLVVVISIAQAVPSGTKVVFVRNNEIFVGADGSQPRQITHDGLRKFLPVWSKDGSRIAFNRDIDVNRGLGELVVIDEKGREINAVLVRPVEKAPPEGMRFVEDMEWLSSNRIAVSGSMNPALTETLILDLESGVELDDIYDDAGGPTFSPDGTHSAFLDGMPHFSPEDSWQPKLNVDDNPVFPKSSSTHVVFLTPPQWSSDSSKLAIVAQDYKTKTVNLVIWRSSGTISTFPVGAAPDEQIDLFWNGAVPYVKAGSRAWQLKGNQLADVPAELAVNPSEHAALEEKKLEASVHEPGARNWDFWCQSCSLATLPRRQTVNK